MDLSIVIPVYRAKSTIGERLHGLASFLQKSPLRFEIIPVDDGSGDGTAEELAKLKDAPFRSLTGEPHRGKFGALCAGVAASIGNCVLFTDADLPYELAAIPYFTNVINQQGYHVAVGDRTLAGSEYQQHLSPMRRFATRAYSSLIRIFVTGGLHDTQCGLKAFRGDIARTMFPILKEPGFAGDVEVLYIALKNNLTIRRIPVRLRSADPSTVNPVRHGLEMTRALFRIRRRFRRGDYTSAALTAFARQDYWNQENG